MCNWNLCLTFQKGLEEANLEGLEMAEVLESVGLEVPAVASTIYSTRLVSIMYGEKCAVCKWNVSFAFQKD